jgi:hypothetical protein
MINLLLKSYFLQGTYIIILVTSLYDAVVFAFTFCLCVTLRLSYFRVIFLTHLIDVMLVILILYIGISKVIDKITA